jgi:hypothetical protein
MLILTLFDYSANMENDPGTVGQSVVNILTSVDDVKINHSADVENDPGTVKWSVANILTRVDAESGSRSPPYLV